MTDNSGSASRRSITLEPPRVETPQKPLDKLGLEAEELRASRQRIVLAADADRRRFERELHDGPQQHLVALSVNLQLARDLLETDPAAAHALLVELERDVRQALAETARLAQRIYPPLLESGGLGAALRSAAASFSVRASIVVPAGATYPPEIAGTVYLCWLEALERGGAGTRATITVRAEKDGLVFELVTDAAGSDAGHDRLRDRVDALGGCLTISSEPGGSARIAGSLPLPR